MYVDFAYYAGVYGGDAIPEEAFAKAEAKAEAIIQYLTYGKGDIFTDKDTRIGQAVCTAAEVVYFQEKRFADTAGAGIKSESNDGYSVTYVTEAQDGQTAEEALRKKVAEAIRPYLLPTGWLGRRVRMGGCGDGCTDCNYSL